jgi:protein-L-isoaspartate(D-aspartate) O-methyltransferase
MEMIIYHRSKLNLQIIPINMFSRKDTPRHQGMRNQLVKGLMEKGITDKAVLAAISKIPRHWFMDSLLERHAYEDKPFPIAAGQTISQPYTVAFQTQLLQVNPGDKILEVGTGSGYQAAVLLEIGAEVYTIERQKELYDITGDFLAELGYFPERMIYGDGYLGLPDYAPYKGIIVTAGAPYVPKALLQQLATGGRLVIPVGENEQEMTVYIRKGEKRYTKEEYGVFRFVPLIKDKN